METYKTLIFNEANKICLIDNKEVVLTKKEYELLLLFLTNKNTIFSREDLLNRIWKKQVSLRTIDTNIARLRKKLKQYSSNLITRTGFGYGFNE